MKRKKLPVLSAACAGMTLFASCGMFYQPVKEYFSEYTETAAVVSWSADGSYPADSGGVTCLPSGNTRTVTLTLRNPQHYTFNLTGSSLPDAAAAECTILTSEGERALSVTQDASDTTTIYASFPDALLTAMEKGGDISLTLRMVEPKSGRSFDSYTVPLHANSAPPDVSGAVVYTDSSTNTYVVCFYMPRKEKLASTGIHSDITSLTINGTVYPVALTDSGTFTFTSGSGVLLQTKPADTIVQNNVVFADKTVPPFYMQPVYFMSGDTVSADNTTYTLTLTDKMGLTSSIKTSVKAVQLGQVTVTDSSGRTLSGGDELSQDDGSSYSTVTISPPAVTTFTGSDGNTTTYDTSDASVIYEVYKTDGTTTTLLFDGKSIHGTATIQLPAGQIELYAYARKSLFADAAPVELGCTILTTRAYVNPDYTGTSTGSRDYPFITITDAVTALSDKTSSANTITLLGNVTSAQNASHSGTVLYLTPGDFTDSSGAACTALRFTLKSDGSSTYTLGTAGSGLCGLYAADGTSVTLKNIAVQGWNSGGVSAEITAGAVVALTGSTSFAYEETDKGTYTSYNGTVKLDGTTSSTAGLVIAGGCTTDRDKIAVLDPVYRGIALPVITAGAGYTLTEDTTGKFSITYSYNDTTKTYTGYYVYCKNDTGILMPTGANVIAEFADGGYDSVTLVCSTTTFTQGSTITLSAPSITDTTNVTAAAITGVTLNKLSSGETESTGTVSGGIASLTVPSSLTPGQYELQVTGSVTAYGVTNTWSASLEILVVYEVAQ